MILRTPLLLSLFAAGLALAAGQPENSSSYKITIPQDNHKIAIVEVSLIPIDKTLYMFRGANRLPKRWSTFVSNCSVLQTSTCRPANIPVFGPD